MLAERQLSPASKSEIRRLLSVEPGATLVSISTEADDDRTAATAPWHYVNMPRDSACHYDASRDCIGGQCVVGAIEAQIRILESATSDGQRLAALKYIVHLVADVHQPLHAAFADDRGGNRYQLQAFGRGTNLHELWDVGMIENWPGGLRRLRRESAVGRKSSPLGTPSRWAEESCRIASASDFYPAERTVGDEYLNRWRSTLSERLSSASVRLATILNASLR